MGVPSMPSPGSNQSPSWCRALPTGQHQCSHHRVFLHCAGAGSGEAAAKEFVGWWEKEREEPLVKAAADAIQTFLTGASAKLASECGGTGRRARAWGALQGGTCPTRPRCAESVLRTTWAGLTKMPSP